MLLEGKDEVSKQELIERASPYSNHPFEKSRQVNQTSDFYSAMSSMGSTLVPKGFVRIGRDGRKWTYALTQQGKCLARKLHSIKTVVEDATQEVRTGFKSSGASRDECLQASGVNTSSDATAT